MSDFMMIDAGRGGPSRGPGAAGSSRGDTLDDSFARLYDGSRSEAPKRTPAQEGDAAGPQESGAAGKEDGRSEDDGTLALSDQGMASPTDGPDRRPGVSAGQAAGMLQAGIGTGPDANPRTSRLKGQAAGSGPGTTLSATGEPQRGEATGGLIRDPGVNSGATPTSTRAEIGNPALPLTRQDVPTPGTMAEAAGADVAEDLPPRPEAMPPRPVPGAVPTPKQSAPATAALPPRAVLMAGSAASVAGSSQAGEGPDDMAAGTAGAPDRTTPNAPEPKPVAGTAGLPLSPRGSLAPGAPEEAQLRPDDPGAPTPEPGRDLPRAGAAWTTRPASERVGPSTAAHATDRIGGGDGAGMRAGAPLSFGLAALGSGEQDHGLAMAEAALGTSASASPAAVAGSAQATAAHAPHLAQQVARQIALSVIPLPDGPVEISLSPEELGRVRLTVSVVDGTVAMNVQADRPETADLLRRHIEALAQEFRDLGYDQSTFSFGHSGGGSAGAGSDKAEEGSAAVGMRSAAEAETAGDRTGPAHSGTARNGGIDLRL